MSFKIDPYNLELYCFKFGAFFETVYIVGPVQGWKMASKKPEKSQKSKI